MVIYENQALRINFTTGIDDASTSSVELKYRDPDGVEGTFSETPVVVEAEDGEYYIELANDVLEDGIWTFWSYVVDTSDNEFPGNPWQEYIAPEGQYPVSRERIKAFLGITGTTQDARIDAMIPVLIAQYLSIRNAPWDTITDDEENQYPVYPAGMEAVIAQMYEYSYNTQAGNYKEATAERIGSYSITYGGGSGSGVQFGYPTFITSQIKSYVRGC